jgi:hypothetical protein
VLPMLHTFVLKYDQSEPFITPILKPFIDAQQLLGHPGRCIGRNQRIAKVAVGRFLTNG